MSDERVYLEMDPDVVPHVKIAVALLRDRLRRDGLRLPVDLEKLTIHSEKELAREPCLLVDEREAARRLSISDSTLRRHPDLRALRVKLGGLTKYRAADLEWFAASLPSGGAGLRGRKSA